MNKPIQFALSLAVLLTAAVAGGHAPRNFDEAKRELGKIHRQNPQVKTFYCGCAFTGGHIDPTTCGLAPKHDARRAVRLEWEHVVPAEALGGGLPSWAIGDPQCNRHGKPYKGRPCARKASVEFRLAEADMHNLFPAEGEINGLRSSLPMGEVPGEDREFGACDAEVGKIAFEPRPEVKGDVARATLYMADRYPNLFKLTVSQRGMFDVWSFNDPADAWEKERNEIIGRLQGNKNPYIK